MFVFRQRSCSEFGKVGDKEGLACLLLRVTLFVLFNVSVSLIEGILVELGLSLLATNFGFDLSCNLFHIVSSEVSSAFGINATPALLKSCLNLSLELLRADLLYFREHELSIFDWILVQDRRAQWEWSQFVGELGTVTNVDSCLLAVLVEGERTRPDKRANHDYAMAHNFT